MLNTDNYISIEPGLHGLNHWQNNFQYLIAKLSNAIKLNKKSFVYFIL